MMLRIWIVGVWLATGVACMTGQKPLFLRQGNLSDAAVRALHLPEKISSDSTSVAALKHQVLAWAEARGFAFAAVRLDSITENEVGYSAAVMLEQGPFIRFGKVEVKGSAQVSAAYISLYTGIKEGQPYSFALIQAAIARLKSLSFASLQYDPVIAFNGDEAQITFYLTPKNASRFDALLGLQPSGQEQVQRRFVVTGILTADLINNLGKGERLAVNFRQLKPQTQQLQLQGALPYPFGQPLGLDANFAIYRLDTTYLDVSWEAGVRFLAPGLNYVRLFYEQFSTRLLDVDVSEILSTRSLPPQLDAARRMLGVEVSWQKLDFRFNPRKGWQVWAQVSGGLREIVPNTGITSLVDPQEPSFSFAGLYDGKSGRKWQTRTQLRYEHFVPLSRYGAVRLAGHGGLIGGNARPLRNELFRAGGARLLRGFDEESQFAAAFGVLTAEYRLLAGTYSYFSAFADYGQIWNEVRQQKIGLGVGMALDTKAGILQLSLAVGKDGEAAFDFRSLKTHIGYVNVF